MDGKGQQAGEFKHQSNSKPIQSTSKLKMSLSHSHHPASMRLCCSVAFAGPSGLCSWPGAGNLHSTARLPVLKAPTDHCPAELRWRTWEEDGKTMENNFV